MQQNKANNIIYQVYLVDQRPKLRDLIVSIVQTNMIQLFYYLIPKKCYKSILHRIDETQDNNATF